MVVIFLYPLTPSVATVAQYIYHRQGHRLPTLATLLLKRLATAMPMSILACLGTDAEPLRDMFLTRLGAVSEDIGLKVRRGNNVH